jgi:hypothetical protein
MDQVKEWFTNYEKDLERVRRFWQGEGRYLISLTTGQEYYRQIFDDAEILRKAPKHLEVQASLPGTNLPSFFADFGTVSTAKYWGGQTHFDSTGGNIFIDPVVQTLDEALKLKPLPVDHPEMDAAHGLQLYKQLCQALGTESLWFRSPDMQGTLNTAGLIMNQEQMLVDMFSRKPKCMHFSIGSRISSSSMPSTCAHKQPTQTTGEVKYAGTCGPTASSPMHWGFHLPRT